MNELDGSFSSPTEELMLYTAGLMLSAGREPEIACNIASKDIRELIGIHGLETLLARLSDSDAEEVRSDLELLEII
ncbi:hypothetical protein [Pseudomonas batumici]|uniref:hypothetical protein n=1 Tax=Pseudomonas batumici TaxID=226910 RepID=UPI0012EE9CD5|nr:hypothetical protein [Pseudomonas batumici]